MVLLGFSLTALAKRAFIENIGQITDQYQNKRPDIIAKYQADNGLNIFLSNSGIHYQWAKENEMYRMDVKLVGANPNPRISREAPTGLREQYQLAELKGTANGFGKIVYHDIYPDIDWVFYFNPDGKLEHDFIVRPGAQVSDIKLQYLGAENLQINRFGNLVATTKYGSISEPAPHTYELATNKKIASFYKLNGDLLTFKTAAFKGTLVIDPVINWATYFGDSEYDGILDLKIAKDGFVYVVGATNSSSNIATTGAHLTSFQGGTGSKGSDAFMAKFSEGGTCVWSTYYGGTNVDMGLSLVIDTAGNLYMAGRTNSQSGIATPGSHQQVKAGNVSGYDAFLVKFDTSGIPLWGTYRGGNFNEGTTGLTITADRYNNIYMAGNTNSSTGIATTGSFQQTRPGGEEGFIAKFNTSGNLIWSTYYGSVMNDCIDGIITDTAGNLVIVGFTEGSTGLSTTGSYLGIGNGGTDGFVAKFDSSGQRLWGTYFGGDDYDRLYSVVTDSSNNIYFAGLTYSTSDIASSGAHQTVIGSVMDACIGKFDAAGNIQWSTYYGGSDNDAITALAFSHNQLFATGTTISPNNIVTTDAIFPVFNNSSSEGMLVAFSAAGTRLYGTYFGGDVTEDPLAITVSGQGQVFIGGETGSINGFATAGAHQNTFGGMQDGLLLSINMCNVPNSPTTILGSTSVCENSAQQYRVSPVNGAESYIWLLPVDWTGSSNTDTINTLVGASSGTVSVVAVNSCGTSDTISIAVSVTPAPVPDITRNGNILSVSQTFTNYQWMLDGYPIPGATNPTCIITQNGTYTLDVTGANGCNGLSNEIVVTDHTSMNDLEKLGVKVYPNPFDERLFISAPIGLQLVVSDLSGRVLYQSDVERGIRLIDIDKLHTGNYVLNIYDIHNGKLLGTTTLVKFSK